MNLCLTFCFVFNQKTKEIKNNKYLNKREKLAMKEKNNISINFIIFLGPPLSCMPVTLTVIL